MQRVAFRQNDFRVRLKDIHWLYYQRQTLGISLFPLTRKRLNLEALSQPSDHLLGTFSTNCTNFYKRSDLALSRNVDVRDLYSRDTFENVTLFSIASIHMVPKSTV